jgi:hypothetical protein
MNEAAADNRITFPTAARILTRIHFLELEQDPRQ